MWNCLDRDARAPGGWPSPSLLQTVCGIGSWGYIGL
jgi:hypothetical protein